MKAILRAIFVILLGISLPLKGSAAEDGLYNVISVHKKLSIECHKGYINIVDGKLSDRWVDFYENRFNSLEDFIFHFHDEADEFHLVSTPNKELPEVGVASYWTEGLSGSNSGEMIISKSVSEETWNRISEAPILSFEGHVLNDPTITIKLTYNYHNWSFFKGTLGEYRLEVLLQERRGTLCINLINPNKNGKRSKWKGRLLLNFCEGDPLMLVGGYFVEGEPGKLVYLKLKS